MRFADRGWYYRKRNKKLAALMTAIFLLAVTIIPTTVIAGPGETTEPPGATDTIEAEPDTGPAPADEPVDGAPGDEEPAPQTTEPVEPEAAETDAVEGPAEQGALMAPVENGVKSGMLRAAIASMDLSTLATGGAGYTVESVNGDGASPYKLIFTTGANGNTYTLTQTGDSLFTQIVVNAGVTTTITLNGINVINPDETTPVFLVAPTASVTLKLLDNTNNYLTHTGASTQMGDRAALNVPKGASLTVRGEVSSAALNNGRLIATGGSMNPGIGGGQPADDGAGPWGAITLENGIIIARAGSGGNGAAGIGGADTGGQTVTGNGAIKIGTNFGDYSSKAYVTATGSGSGSGIGSGGGGVGGDGAVTVIGHAHITASSPGGYGIGCEGGTTSIASQGVDVKAYSGDTRSTGMAIYTSATSVGGTGLMYSLKLVDTRASDTTFKVYRGTATATPPMTEATTLTLPAHYPLFAYYLSGYTSVNTPPIDRIDAYNGPEFIGVVRTISGDSTQIGRSSKAPIAVRIGFGTVVSAITATSAEFTSIGHEPAGGANFVSGGFRYSTTKHNTSNTLTGNITTVPWPVQDAASPKTQVISGLRPNTQYYMLAYIDTDDGSYVSTIVYFTTMPSITGASAARKGFDATKALINAQFSESPSANPAITAVKIYWDTGAIDPANPAAAAHSATPTSAQYSNSGLTDYEITGLTQGSVYNFLIVITNSAGNTDSLAFTYAAVAPGIIPGTPSVSAIGSGSATFTSTGHKINAGAYISGGFRYAGGDEVDANGMLIGVGATDKGWSFASFSESPISGSVTGFTEGMTYYVQTYLNGVYSEVIAFQELTADVPPIDLSKTTTNGMGYSVTTPSTPNPNGVATPTGILTLNAEIEGRLCRIIQSDGPGTSIYRKIVVAAGVKANIIISGIDVTGRTVREPTFALLDAADVDLILEGNNSLQQNAGIDPANGNSAALNVPEGTAITIGGTGYLYVNGGHASAGIGGGYQQSAGNITITGGSIEAVGGGHNNQWGSTTTNLNVGGAGIGGGAARGSSSSNPGDPVGGGGGVITITGGKVKASSDENSLTSNSGAGIGGGYYGNGGIITISGGEVDTIGRDGSAAIGSGGGEGIDKITITGGNIRAIGGGVGIGGYVRTKGDIDISGGTIYAKGGYRYAAIGADTVTISGTADIIAQGGGVPNSIYYGAGISSNPYGTGFITIRGGTIDARGNSYSAAIGGNYCDPAGTITISGGTIKAVADLYGAGIGSSGFTSSNAYRGGDEFINITGGTIEARGGTSGYYEGSGAGIGSGGAEYTSFGTSVMTINISGDADITAIGGAPVSNARNPNSQGGAGIGNGGSGMSTRVNIDENATVKAYSYGRGGNKAIRSATDNEYAGYYVNAYFSSELPTSNTVRLDVYEDEGSAVTDELYLPGDYCAFAYTTKRTTAQIDTIIAYDNESNAELKTAQTKSGVVVRTADNSKQIYSVNTRAGYNGHDGVTTQGALPVWLYATTTLTVSKTIPAYGDREKGFIFNAYFKDPTGTTVIPAGTELPYVLTGSGITAPQNGTLILDANGKAIFTLKHGQKITMAEVGTNWQIQQITETNSSGYTVTYKDSTTTDYVGVATNWPKSMTAAPRTFDFRNRQSSSASVRIAKNVAGENGDTAKDFAFTIYFKYSTGIALPAGAELTYTGGRSNTSIPLPSSGTMILDEEGKATFTLKHGQYITIASVATQGRIQIDESGDTDYTTKILDSSGPVTINSTSTGLKTITSATTRTFTFTNTKKEVPPEGVFTGDTGRAILLCTAALLLCAAMAGAAYRRRRKTRRAGA